MATINLDEAFAELQRCRHKDNELADWARRYGVALVNMARQPALCQPLAAQQPVEFRDWGPPSPLGLHGFMSVIADLRGVWFQEENSAQVEGG